MNWPVYERLKDWDAPWLGGVPADWAVTAVKNRFDIVLGKMLNAGVVAKEGSELPYLRAGNIQPHGLDISEIKSTHFSIAEKKALNLKRGDLVVVEGGAGFGRSAVLSEDLEGWGFQNHVMRLRPKQVDRADFLNYVMLSLNSNGHIATLSNHATIPSLSSDQLGRILVPFPDVETQTAIVSFLDRETAKIDALIDKQEQLITTLREDRAATITHAVTQGLSPSSELVDAGTAAVGKYPNGWTLGRLKFWISKIESGTSVNAADVPASPEELGVLKTSCVYTGNFNAGENKTVSLEEIDRVSCPLRPKTLIVSRMNTPDLVGSAGYVDNAPGNLYLPDRLWQVSFRESLAEWFAYWSKTPAYRDQLKSVCVGTSSSMQNISQGDYGSLLLAVPPVEEQGEIVKFLDSACASINVLIEKSTQMIAVLREYRSALITNAVTGKIDVREAV